MLSAIINWVPLPPPPPPAAPTSRPLPLRLQVVLGWYGAQDRHVAKYAGLLAEEGYPSLRGVQPGAAVFSPLPLPRRRYAERLLGSIAAADPQGQRPIVFYAFSNGEGAAEGVAQVSCRVPAAPPPRTCPETRVCASRPRKHGHNPPHATSLFEVPIATPVATPIAEVRVPYATRPHSATAPFFHHARWRVCFGAGGRAPARQPRPSARAPGGPRRRLHLRLGALLHAPHHRRDGARHGPQPAAASAGDRAVLPHHAAHILRVAAPPATVLVSAGRGRWAAKGTRVRQTCCARLHHMRALAPCVAANHGSTRFDIPLCPLFAQGPHDTPAPGPSHAIPLLCRRPPV